MPTDIQITTEMLYQGALFFALMDTLFVTLLAWRVREETFRRLKWILPPAAALTWWGIWSWAIGNFWETVYRLLPAFHFLSHPPIETPNTRAIIPVNFTDH